MIVPGERFTHRLYSDPFLDWVLVLIVAVVIAVLLVAVDVSVYLGTSAHLNAPAPSATVRTSQAIDTVLLQKTVDAFNNRAADHSALEKGYSASADPSLP